MFAGCLRPGMGTPDLDQFPMPNLKHEINRPRDKVRNSMINYFASRAWPAREEVQGKSISFITSYDQDENGSNQRRRRSAFLLRILPSDSDSVNLSVTWIVESKGNNEEMWRTTEDDSDYTPKQLSSIVSFILDL